MIIPEDKSLSSNSFEFNFKMCRKQFIESPMGALQTHETGATSVIMRKVKELIKEKRKLINTDDSMVITRGQGGEERWGVKGGKW